jgi:KipI family sensor histidine kinase inhibitor
MCWKTKECKFVPSNSDSQNADVTFEIRSCGDDLLSLSIGDTAKCQALADRIRKSGNWLECVAGIDSVVVQFDNTRIEPSDARRRLELETKSPVVEPDTSGEVLELPVCYGGEYGPDLEELSVSLGLSPVDIIKLHSGQEYRVDMLGFTPGFAYIGGLDKALNVPRLMQPRLRVAAGSIGIADGRTGVYALPGPGGWQIIGRTTHVLFDPSSEQPFQLLPNARVRFKAISEDEFATIDKPLAKPFAKTL